MSRICLLTITAMIFFLQHTSASDIILSSPRTTIKAQIGEELHITCEASTCDKPEFIWASVIDQTLSGTVTTVGQKSTLTMKVSSDSDGFYRCNVSPVSCNQPPGEKRFQIAIYSFPSDPILHISSLVVGEQSRITCTLLNIYRSEMMTAQILLDEKIVAEYDDAGMDEANEGMQNVSLFHDLVLQERNEGMKIKCEADLKFEDYEIESIQRHTSMDLHLMYPPVKPQISFNSSTVRAGEAISLTCSSESGFQAYIQWVKLDNGKELEMSSDAQGRLILPSAEPEDSGVYICYAKNNIGKTSSQVEISVQVPPKNTYITITPSPVVREGDSVQITCTSEASPTPRLVLKMKTDHGLIELESESGQYNISHAGVEHIGTYICESKNVVGQQVAETILTVQVPPKNTHITITQSPVVREGDSVQITCTSEASPTPRLVLKMKTEHGMIELESESGQYNISHAGVGHIGTYICESTNVVGEQVAETILTVQVPPKNTHITITPSPVVREGDSVQITCTSEASPTPRLVLKMKTDHGLIELESESGQYNISHAGVEHIGTYICESKNVVGQQVAETILTVQVPPKNTHITITPSPVVREGDSVQITCTSEASPTPRLVLKMKTDHGMTELESESGQYNISHAGVGHIGTYICESKNVVGQQVAETILTVQVPPKNTHITITPSPVVREGDSVQITCTSEASPTPRLVLRMKTDHGLIELESESGQYNISHPGVEHIGTYICESKNVVGQQVAETILTVQVPPKNTHITITPSPVVREGDSVQITCTSEASPTPRLVLKMKTDHGMTELESESGQYNISHAGVGHIGTYICESKNVVGQQVAETILTVQVPQRNTTVVVTPSQNVTEGDTITITCETHSIPSPTIILQKVCARNSTVLHISNGTFTLHNVTRNDTGTYTLNIISSDGNETAVISIIVAERQQSPRFNPISVIIGSIAFASAGIIGVTIYYLKQAKGQGSYSLVKALRSKV